MIRWGSCRRRAKCELVELLQLLQLSWRQHNAVRCSGSVWDDLTLLQGSGRHGCRRICIGGRCIWIRRVRQLQCWSVGNRW